MYPLSSLWGKVLWLTAQSISFRRHLSLDVLLIGTRYSTTAMGYKSRWLSFMRARPEVEKPGVEDSMRSDTTSSTVPLSSTVEFDDSDESPQRSRTQTITGGFVVQHTSHTTRGPRHHNEDGMLSAVLKFTSPAMRDKDVHLFAVIDGHGGSGCSLWLVGSLESCVRASPSWKLDGIPLGDRLRLALKFAIERAEAQFLEVAAVEGDKSGACLVISLFCEGHLCVVRKLKFSNSMCMNVVFNACSIN
jgi:hypothetical protein